MFDRKKRTETVASVLVIDDHKLFRAGLRRILDDFREPRLEFDEAGDCRAAISKLARRHYDLVFLDIKLGEKTGLTLLEEIKTAHPNQAVIMLSMYPEEVCALRAFVRGASGYLTKDCELEQLTDAIKTVLGGRRYFSEHVSELLVKSVRGGQNKSPHEKLSEREFDVMCLLAEGYKLAVIGERLHLSRKTITSYKTKIFQKMGFQDRAALTRYVIENGLVDI